MRAAENRPCQQCAASAPSVRPLHWARGLPSRQTTWQCRAGEQKQPMISEDVLARLKQAEDEAARLRKQLADVQAAKGGPTSWPDKELEAKPKRIDGTSDRESPFSKGRASWLSEADVSFFVPGEQPQESKGDVGPGEDEAGQLRRNLLIGGLLSAATVAFALIPTETLRVVKPSQPLVFYIIPLLRIQDLLRESQSIIEEADWATLRLVLARVQGIPNNAQQNLDNCVALLGGQTQAKASALASEINVYLDAIDYNKYYDAIPTRTISGAQSAEFVRFSSEALKTAQLKLGQFLALLPSDALQQAVEKTAMNY